MIWFFCGQGVVLLGCEGADAIPYVKALERYLTPASLRLLMICPVAKLPFVILRLSFSILASFIL